MKVYVLEYDFELFKMNSLTSEIEHRKETYLDITNFINRVKYLNSKWYNSNIKVYTGIVEEIDIDKVLNPF